jgi:putative transposase
MKGQKLYLSACMDSYKVQIIGYCMARCPVFDFVSSKPYATFRRVKPAEGLVVHSDRRRQYTMPPYQAMLKRHGVTQKFHLVKCNDLVQLEAGVHD